MISWFCPPGLTIYTVKETFSYKEIQFKKFLPPVKTSCPPAENINDPILIFISNNFQAKNWIHYMYKGCWGTINPQISAWGAYFKFKRRWGRLFIFSQIVAWCDHFLNTSSACKQQHTVGFYRHKELILKFKSQQVLLIFFLNLPCSQTETRNCRMLLRKKEVMFPVL